MLKIQIWISSQGSFSKCKIHITTCLLVSRCSQIIFWSFPTSAPPGCFPRHVNGSSFCQMLRPRNLGVFLDFSLLHAFFQLAVIPYGKPLSPPLGLSPDPSSSISNLDCYNFLQDGFSCLFPSFSSLFLKARVCFPNYKDPKSPHLT